MPKGTLADTSVIGIKDLTEKFQALADGVGGAGRAEVTLAGAEKIAEAVRRNIAKQDLIETGALLDSVEARKVNQWTAAVWVGREGEPGDYAAAHEYGAQQIVTERQRNYFRFRCASSGDYSSKWCAMMNTDVINIPARPYFRPAILQARKKARTAMAQDLLRLILDILGR